MWEAYFARKAEEADRQAMLAFYTIAPWSKNLTFEMVRASFGWQRK